VQHRDNEVEDSPLIGINNLRHGPGAIWEAADPRKRQDLPYSDGRAEEEYIFDILQKVRDLSSHSEELQTHIRDWASECHLSAARANVYRPLDFSGVKTILEVGSGCGAVTRFLGELGAGVDAVEGSRRRAEITRLRCRDLANVTVIHGDFNALELPSAHYDLIVLTGVLEYVGKYSPAGKTPMDAAVAMLKRLFSCLSPTGRLIVAIENRIGFKYLTGAGEDHFARPWVGVSGYPSCHDPALAQKRGIETWDRGQWREMIARLPHVVARWYYPFPDYKLATTLLSGDFIRNEPFAWACLSRVGSRDYTAVWHAAVEEQLFWQTAGAAGALEEFANSFVLILGRKASAASVDPLVTFDFVHFAGQQRRPEFRVMIRKGKGDKQVEKIPLFPGRETRGNTVVSQSLETEPYISGELLISRWTNGLRCSPSVDCLDDLLREYYAYLSRVFAQYPAHTLVDLLPTNIVVDTDGTWHFFDQEWHATTDISPAFVFFRAVFNFFWYHKQVIEPFCTKQNLETGRDFVAHCLQRTLFSAEIDLDAFIKLENEIQQAISGEDGFITVETLLESSCRRPTATWSWRNAVLVWGEEAVTSPVAAVAAVAAGTRLTFRLPAASAQSEYLQLRLGMGKEQLDCALRVERFSLYGYGAAGGRKRIFPAGKGESPLPPLMDLTGLRFYSDIRGGVYTVEEAESQALHFLFSVPDHGEEFSAYDCEILLEFLGKIAPDIRLEQCRLDNLAKSRLLENQAKQLEKLQQGLLQIEQSRGWRVLCALRNIREKLRFNRKPEQGGDTDDPRPPAMPGGTADRGGRQGIFLSVIMAVYNTGGDELRQTVESVLSQSFHEWELIIVDSCSSDGVTGRALAEISHPRIKVHFLQRSKNLTQALENGCRIATGEWVTFLGGFDRLPADAFESFAREVRRRRLDVVYGNHQLIGRYGDLLETRSMEPFSWKETAGLDPRLCCLYIRNRMIRRLGGPDPEMEGVHLYDLLLRAARHTNRIAHLDLVLYQCRRFEQPTADELRRYDDLGQWARRRNPPPASALEGGIDPERVPLSE